MAITFEQKRRGSGIFWGMAFIVFVGGGLLIGYQIFFAPVEESFVSVLSQDQQIISDLAKIAIDPASVVNSPNYKALRKHIPDVTSGQTGRANPFLPF